MSVFSVVQEKARIFYVEANSPDDALAVFLESGGKESKHSPSISLDVSLYDDDMPEDEALSS